ncbi:hypothetical protein DFH09DRAFT_1098014 [Mycena vulgaris]|nr:hypothetical protein DFH09DRAFT_1098014 [Mycena vulgaris]
MCSSTQAARICGEHSHFLRTEEESDPTLRVAPPNGLPSFNDTVLSITVRHGDGSNFVSGDIGVGAFQLDSSTRTQAKRLDFDDGIFGLWGLGFNTLGSSEINDAGQSVLANMFALNASGADYIGISLSRTGDQEWMVDGSLTIAEYDSDYDAVQNTPHVPQVPPNTGSWTVVLDGFGLEKIDWPSKLTVAPPGTNIVLLDTARSSNF